MSDKSRIEEISAKAWELYIANTELTPLEACSLSVDFIRFRDEKLAEMCHDRQKVYEDALRRIRDLMQPGMIWCTSGISKICEEALGISGEGEEEA